MEDIKTTVAQQISQLRAENGMTQLELAEKLHYSDKAVSKWERGESIPEIATLVAIADLFDVSLDRLIRGEAAKTAEAEIALPLSKRKRTNRAIITVMSVLLVWLIASLAFVVFDLLGSFTSHWLAYVCATPVSMIVWLVFNSIWFNTKRNYLIISILMWSILAALHICFIAFSINIWQIYLLGIPGQLIILLWSRMYREKSKKSK